MELTGAVMLDGAALAGIAIPQDVDQNHTVGRLKGALDRLQEIGNG